MNNFANKGAGMKYLNNVEKVIISSLLL